MQKKDILNVALVVMTILTIVVAVLCGVKFVGQRKAASDDENLGREMVWAGIPLFNYETVSVPITKGATIVSSDGVCTWEFTDGTKITVYQSDHHVGMKNLSPHVYYNKESAQYVYDGYSVVVESSKEVISDVCSVWEKYDPCTYTTEVNWDSSCQMEKLPTSHEVKGVESPKGVILPGTVYPRDKSLYSAEVWKDGISYMSAYVKYEKMSEVEKIIYANVNMFGEEYYWYKSSDIIFASTDTMVAAAKKITENKYIVYVASVDKLDFVLVNLAKTLDIK